MIEATLLERGFGAILVAEGHGGRVAARHERADAHEALHGVAGLERHDERIVLSTEEREIERIAARLGRRGAELRAYERSCVQDRTYAAGAREVPGVLREAVGDVDRGERSSARRDAGGDARQRPSPCGDRGDRGRGRAGSLLVALEEREPGRGQADRAGEPDRVPGPRPGAAE